MKLHEVAYNLSALADNEPASPIIVDSIPPSLRDIFVNHDIAKNVSRGSLRNFNPMKLSNVMAAIEDIKRIALSTQHIASPDADMFPKMTDPTIRHLHVIPDQDVYILPDGKCTVSMDGPNAGPLITWPDLKKV